MRLTGIFTSPVGFMIVGVTGVIAMAWYALQQKVRSGKFYFYSLFATIGLVLLVLTGGRTAMASIVIGVFILMLHRLKRNVAIAVAMVIVLSPAASKVILAFPGFQNVRAKLMSTKDTRSALYRLAWDEIEVKPWTGWGTGVSDVKSTIAAGKTYHQTYLQFAVDHGIPAAVVIMLIFLWLPLRGLLLMRSCHTEELRSMANLSSGLLAAYIFHSFLSGDLAGTTGILPVFSMIGLQEGVRAENKRIELYLDEYLEEESVDGYSAEMISANYLAWD
jgi:O-antigen ligase